MSVSFMCLRYAGSCQVCDRVLCLAVLNGFLFHYVASYYSAVAGRLSRLGHFQDSDIALVGWEKALGWVGALGWAEDGGGYCYPGG
jgi:hypothetical protein